MNIFSIFNYFCLRLTDERVGRSALYKKQKTTIIKVFVIAMTKKYDHTTSKI